MSVRPETFQNVVLQQLEVHSKLLQFLSDAQELQRQIVESLIEQVHRLKGANQDEAAKLQDELSALHGKIVALKPPRKNP